MLASQLPLETENSKVREAEGLSGLVNRSSFLIVNFYWSEYAGRQAFDLKHAVQLPLVSGASFCAVGRASREHAGLSRADGTRRFSGHRWCAANLGSCGFGR